MQQKGAWILGLYTVLAVICYYPVLGNTFLSDDYDSLYRVLIEKTVIYKGFLRPLTDVLFYFNYLLTGLNPLGYYLLNLLLHILCAFMVYRIALRLSLFDDERRLSFAVTAGLLFLLYPFHNEGIAWLTGRIISAACLCGLLALQWSLQEEKPWKHFAAAALVFLLGLTGYESIILLPLIILVLRLAVVPSRRQLPAIMAAWTGVVLLYVVVRYYLSGTVTASYGERMFSFSGMAALAQRAGKAGIRLLVPSEESPFWMIIMAGLAVVIVVLLHLLLLRRKQDGPVQRRKYKSLAAGLFIAMLLPAAFGISTRTSEGDRLLYFPSVFLCLMGAYLLFVLIPGLAARRMVICAVLLVSIYLLEQNNNRWKAASLAANAVMTASGHTISGRCVLINMPDEIEGAYVFRNGFKKALVINGIDTGKVVVIDMLPRLLYLQAPARIVPEGVKDSLFIYPSARIYCGDSSCRIVNTVTGRQLTLGQHDRVYYWDKTVLAPLGLK